MSDSIQVDVTNLDNVDAEVIVAPTGGLEITPTGVGVKTEYTIPVGGTTGQALCKDNNDDRAVSWQTVGGGGGTQYEALYHSGQFINADLTEQVFVAIPIAGGALATPGLCAVRLRAWGKINNNTTPTNFQPRIRWNTAANVTTGSPITLLTGPLVVGTSTAQTNKHWDVDMMFTFNAPIAFVTMQLVNHTADSTGLPKIDTVNNTNAGVNVGSTAADHYLMLTWQMDQSHSQIQVESFAAISELLYSQ